MAEHDWEKLLNDFTGSEAGAEVLEEGIGYEFAEVNGVAAVILKASPAYAHSLEGRSPLPVYSKEKLDLSQG